MLGIGGRLSVTLVVEHSEECEQARRQAGEVQARAANWPGPEGREWRKFAARLVTHWATIDQFCIRRVEFPDETGSM